MIEQLPTLLQLKHEIPEEHDFKSFLYVTFLVNTHLRPRPCHPIKVARFSDAVLYPRGFVTGAQTAGALNSGTVWCLMHAPN